MTGQTGHVDPESATQIAAAGGQAAGDAAEAGKNRTEAEEATREAMAAEAERQGVSISDADIKRISEGTIAMLEARGAFEQVPASGQTPAPTGPSSGEPASPSSEQATGGSDGGTAGGSPNPSAEPSPSETPPRKRTFAERFMGKA